MYRRTISQKEKWYMCITYFIIRLSDCLSILLATYHENIWSLGIGLRKGCRSLLAMSIYWWHTSRQIINKSDVLLNKIMLKHQQKATYISETLVHPYQTVWKHKVMHITNVDIKPRIVVIFWRDLNPHILKVLKIYVYLYCINNKMFIL